MIITSESHASCRPTSYFQIDLASRSRKGKDHGVWHTLRHTCASRLVMSGADIRSVQEIMGHKTLAMTMPYSHLSDSHLNRVINRISKGEILEVPDTKMDKRDNDDLRDAL